MRRLIIEEPMSRAAIWSRHAAWLAVCVALISVWLIRSERVDMQTGFVLVGSTALIALVVLMLAVAGFAAVWQRGAPGLGRAILAFVLAGAIFAGPAWFVARGLLLPAINDISTDLDDPPGFSRSRAALEARGGRSAPDPGPEARRKQREAYPGLAPVYLDVTAEEAFDIVRRAVRARGLSVVEAVRPGGRSGLGRIEAVDRTPILRFPDDVTIRIRPRADGARIDIRSASRYGRHDFGTNAARVQRLIDEIGFIADLR
jgi:uncharacterized protein (DUF1499 family)